MENCRIGIVGSAGTGKSQLGYELAEKMKLPFLRASTVTRGILEKDGYDYAGGIQVESFLFQDNRQERLSKKTMKLEIDNYCFVTDRTVIDLAAYAIVELYDGKRDKLDKLLDRYYEHLVNHNYTDVFVCPWVEEVTDNGLRTLNPWYQFLIHSTCLGVMEDWGIKYHILRANKTNDRVKEIIKTIKDKQRVR